MGASNSLPQTETINWKNINTDQVSSTIPNLNKISVEANKLIEKLNIPHLSDSTSDFNNNNIFATKKVNNNLSENNFSSTSPFISSEMYNYVLDKYKNKNMIGGASKVNTKQGNTNIHAKQSKTNVHAKQDKQSKTNELNDDSDTTSTSSSASSTSSEVVKKVDNKKLHSVKKNKINKKDTEYFMDYMSSSAHTGGNNTENTDSTVNSSSSESSSNSSSESSTESSSEVSSQKAGSSIENENILSISSVRTSQLNLVSE